MHRGQDGRDAGGGWCRGGLAGQVGLQVLPRDTTGLAGPLDPAEVEAVLAGHLPHQRAALGPEAIL